MLVLAALLAHIHPRWQQINRHVRRLLSAKDTADEEAKGDGSDVPGTVGAVQQKTYPAGFTTGVKAVDSAASVLRMLYVADLRELQDQVNELLSHLQALTADIQINPRLGKVGR